MHSLDTVKTRQQAAPNVTKYVQLGSAYRSILREEGLVRGLYSGITPAIMGSLPGSMLFFGFYEFSKHQLLDMKTPETLAHLTAGFLGDLLVSTIYVPSEVLKTRLQLQGRHNNPSFNSGYNYRSTWDAIKTVSESTLAVSHSRLYVMKDPAPYTTATERPSCATFPFQPCNLHSMVRHNEHSQLILQKNFKSGLICLPRAGRLVCRKKY